MKKRLDSFKYAFHGILYLIRSQQNARIHVLMACVAVGLGLWLKISNYDWILVTFCIAGVIGAEAFNTAIETLCDTLHPKTHPKIKLVKDLAAAAVLLISIGALIAGIFIFLPKLIGVLSS